MDPIFVYYCAVASIIPLLPAGDPATMTHRKRKGFYAAIVCRILWHHLPFDHLLPNLPFATENIILKTIIIITITAIIAPSQVVVYSSFDRRILVLVMSYFPIIIRPEKKRQPKQKRFQLDLILCLWDGPLNNTALFWQQPESASSSLPTPLSLISKQSSKCLPMWRLPCRLSLELDNIWHWLHHLHKKTTTLIIFCHSCRMWWSCCCRHRCNTWREMPIIIILWPISRCMPQHFIH